LELDGEDLRGMPLGDRKRRLARLLGGRRLGIVLSDHTDEDGATIFRQACRMGLEGHCVEEAARALSVRQVDRVAENQESEQPGDDPGAGSRVVIMAPPVSNYGFGPDGLANTRRGVFGTEDLPFNRSTIGGDKVSLATIPHRLVRLATLDVFVGNFFDYLRRSTIDGNYDYEPNHASVFAVHH
jgi:hypothetical protein